MERLAGAHSLQAVVGLLHFALSLSSKLIDALTAVQRATDLFVGLNKALELNGQVSILVDQNVAVVLKSINFRLNIGVLSLKRLVGEAEVVLLGLGAIELLFAVAALAFQLAELGSKAVVAVTLSLETLAEIALLGLLAVEGALQVHLFILETSSLISGLQKIAMSGIESLVSLFQVVVLVLRNLLELTGTLLKLVEVMLSALDAGVALCVLALFVAVDVTDTVNLLLVTAALFLEFRELEGSGIDIFSESERVVTLGLALTLVAENFSFSAGDLLTKSSDLNLHVVVATVLIVEVVSGIVALFLEAVKGDAV